MPLPKGYKMWIWPTYRLETPKVTITLPNEPGAILAMLVGRYREPVFLGDTMASLHGTPDDGGPVSYTALIQQHVDYLRNYLRQYGIVAKIKVVPGHDCAVLRYIKHVGSNAEQTPYASLNRRLNSKPKHRASTLGRKRRPDDAPLQFRDPRAEASTGTVIPYARLNRQERAEQAGYYERPLTNEELTLLERRQ